MDEWKEDTSLESSHYSKHNTESQIAQLDDLINEKLELAFQNLTPEESIYEVAKIAYEYNPIDLANVISRMPARTRIVVYENLPDLDSKTNFILNSDRYTRYILFKQMKDEDVLELIERMSIDDAVWILDDLSDRRYEVILSHLSPEKAAKINELQKYDRNSAGRLMTDEFFAFAVDNLIGDAAHYIRNNPGIDLARRIFVLNKDNALLGYVPARNLVVNPPNVYLKQVMQPIFHKVFPDTHRDEVVDLMERYKIPALPVVDAHNKLLGVITSEDVIEVMEDITNETIGLLAGTKENVSEHQPTWNRFLARVPWLFVTLIAGLINARSMSYFDGILGQFVLFFVPLITGMSGNVGIQSSTILVRSLATGELTPKMREEAVVKEICIGGLTGLTFGILCIGILLVLGFIGMNFGQPIWPLSIIVCSGLLGSCITASTLGVIFPLTFGKIGIDPAIASGPFVTAINDVMSTLIYFAVVWLVSGFFL